MYLIASVVRIVTIVMILGIGYLTKQLIGPRDIRDEHRIRERLLNTLMGFGSPIGNPVEAIGNVFAAGRKTPQQIGGAQVFRATVEWRDRFLALIAPRSDGQYLWALTI